MGARVVGGLDNVAVRNGRRWWWLRGVVLGLMVFALGVFLTREGLEDANRWAGVISLFVAIAGLAVAVYSAVQVRRTSSTDGTPAQIVRNTVTGAEVAGPAMLVRDAQRVSLTGTPVATPNAEAAGPQHEPTPQTSGGVENRIDGGTFHGPLIMGRDVRDVALPAPPPVAPARPARTDGSGQ